MRKMKAIAHWNPARGCWENPDGMIDLFSEHSEPFSETWPSSGISHRGTAFELPTSAPRIVASVSSSMRSPSTDEGWLLATPDTMPEAPNKGSNSTRPAGLGNQIASLLPTPIASDSDSARRHTTTTGRSHRGTSLGDAVEQITPTANLGSNGPDYARVDRAGSGGDGLANLPAELFPTPIVSDANGVGVGEVDVRESPQLRAVAPTLMPTPVARDGEGSGGSKPALGGERQDDERTQGQVVLEEVADWGKYRAAVERAELVSGIPAPAPAIPDGKGGKMRLHDRFVEWMMLLLPGWVTGHGLTRQKALERLGNGVVPLQAAAATATNLTRLAEYKRAVESLGVAA